jgi:malonyl-CoA decarboxylase
MTQAGILQDLFASITSRGRRLLDPGSRLPATDIEVEALCEGILSSLGEASGKAMAQRFLSAYDARGPESRAALFELLWARYGIDADAAVAAATAYRDNPGADTMQALQDAAEPRRQELLRRLNQAAGATARLVAMREDLLKLLPARPHLREVDMDFHHLFQSWFNRGFLEPRRIDWHTPAVVLEKIIQYEAVHQISDWDDLRRRIDPPDRRLYAFFHPRLPDEPLIFVEVALSRDIPDRIGSILEENRTPAAPEQAKAAVFYSISNCQAGLRGISFGNFLIKQVVEDLSRELPNLKSFVTLSPVPGFAKWLAEQRRSEDGFADAAAKRELKLLDAEEWWRDEEAVYTLQPLLMTFAASYLMLAKTEVGAPVDPVARFHLGNGARLERVNWLADTGASGLGNSHGVMVNYLYRLADIERNHEAFINQGTVATSSAVTRLARPVILAASL